jgi:hypothetical protein
LRHNTVSFPVPVNTYSAGMRARLAFGASLAIDFDTYLIDEFTEIGDERFRRKCAAAFRERVLRSDIILVTHNTRTMRRADAPQIEPVLLFDGDISHGTAAAESQIVAQYIASRAIVDELDPGLDLRALFSTQAADWWARLPLPASIEELVRYWNGQIDPFYDNSTATIVVRLRAFALPTRCASRRRSSAHRKSWSTTSQHGRTAMPSAMPRQRSRRPKGG